MKDYPVDANRIALLGKAVAVTPGREEDVRKLRTIWGLAAVEDPRWVELLQLWAGSVGAADEFTAQLILDRRQPTALMRRDAQAQAAKNFEAHKADVTQDGMYRTVDGQIFKVQWNKASGDGARLYAKRMVVTLVHDSGRTKQVKEIPLVGTIQMVETWTVVSVEFKYAAGAILRLKAEDRMTMEQARQFGALYGTCCRCGRTLTDEESIAAGIGPICAGKI